MHSPDHFMIILLGNAKVEKKNVGSLHFIATVHRTSLVLDYLKLIVMENSSEVVNSHIDQCGIRQQQNLRINKRTTF